MNITEEEHPLSSQCIVEDLNHLHYEYKKLNHLLSDVRDEIKKKIGKEKRPSRFVFENEKGDEYVKLCYDHDKDSWLLSSMITFGELFFFQTDSIMKKSVLLKSSKEGNIIKNLHFYVPSRCIKKDTMDDEQQRQMELDDMALDIKVEYGIIEVSYYDRSSTREHKKFFYLK